MIQFYLYVRRVTTCCCWVNTFTFIHTIALYITIYIFDEVKLYEQTCPSDGTDVLYVESIWESCGEYQRILSLSTSRNNGTVKFICALCKLALLVDWIDCVCVWHWCTKNWKKKKRADFLQNHFVANNWFLSVLTKQTIEFVSFVSENYGSSHWRNSIVFICSTVSCPQRFARLTTTKERQKTGTKCKKCMLRCHFVIYTRIPPPNNFELKYLMFLCEPYDFYDNVTLSGTSQLQCIQSVRDVGHLPASKNHSLLSSMQPER